MWVGPQELARSAPAPGALCRWVGEGSSGWHDKTRAHSTAATVLPLVKLQGYRKESQGKLSWVSPTQTQHCWWFHQEPALSIARLRPRPETI